jgi:hypothetical protein
MVDPNVIAAKLAGLDSRIARIRKHCPADLEQFAAEVAAWLADGRAGHS